MTDQAVNYATALFELAPDRIEFTAVMEQLTEEPVLFELLCNPTLPRGKKQVILEKVFAACDVRIVNLLKLLCKKGDMVLVRDIAEYYEYLCDREAGILSAQLLYVTAIDEAQEQDMKTFLQKKYGCKEVRLTKRETPELIGGFVLKTGNREYDYSLLRRKTMLRQKLVSEEKTV